jgi:hypothetical protein
MMTKARTVKLCNTKGYTVTHGSPEKNVFFLLSVWLAHLVRAPALVCSMCARGAGSIPGQAGRLSLPSLRGR